MTVEILTADEVAVLLKISKRHVYELMKPRTQARDVRENPLPCVRLGTSVRYRKSDVEAWLERLVARGK
jgi:excisionase family DNA binding protein